VVRRFTGPAKKGMHRVAWDLRYPILSPTELDEQERDTPIMNLLVDRWWCLVHSQSPFPNGSMES